MGTARHPSRPVVLYLLLLALALEAVPALFGGIGLLSDPAGEPLGMSVTWLDGTPFRSYLVPGLLLTLFLGVYPLAAAVLLVVRPPCRPLRGLERAVGLHWTWMVAVTSGLAVLVWIVVQVAMLGASHPLQGVIAGMGAAILVIALLPEVRHAYAVGRSTESATVAPYEDATGGNGPEA